jgi:hypothetical protein
VTNKIKQKSTEQTTAEHRAEIAKRLHVIKIGGEFRIIEIPAADGSPFECCPSGFRAERATQILLDDLLDAYAEGDTERVFDYPGRPRDYEQRSAVMEFLEQQNGVANPRELARALIHDRPWERCNDMDSEIPF